MQAKADGDGAVDLVHQGFIQPAHMLTQAFFVNGPDLLQEHNGVLCQADLMTGQGDMGRQPRLPCLTGDGRECLLPVSFWTISTGRVPPCSLPTTGLRSA